jgi:hypothetical protein
VTEIMSREREALRHHICLITSYSTPAVMPSHNLLNSFFCGFYCDPFLILLVYGDLILDLYSMLVLLLLDLYGTKLYIYADSLSVCSTRRMLLQCGFVTPGTYKTLSASAPQQH